MKKKFVTVETVVEYVNFMNSSYMTVDRIKFYHRMCEAWNSQPRNFKLRVGHPRGCTLDIFGTPTHPQAVWSSEVWCDFIAYVVDVSSEIR